MSFVFKIIVYILTGLTVGKISLTPTATKMFDSDRIDLQLRLRLRSTAEADRKSCIGSPKSSITISISSPVKISADSRPTKAWYLESIPDTACHFIGLWALLRRLRCQANHTMTDRNPTVGVTCDVNSDLQVKFHKTF